MLLEYVLIGWIGTQLEGVFIHQDFYTLETCEVAKSLFIENHLSDDKLLFRSWVECVVK